MNIEQELKKPLEIDDSIFNNLSNFREIDDKFKKFSQQASVSIENKYNLIFPKSGYNKGFGIRNKTPEISYNNLQHEKTLSIRNLTVSSPSKIKHTEPHTSKMQNSSLISTMKPSPSPLSSITPILKSPHRKTSILFPGEQEMSSSIMVMDDYIVNHFAFLIDILVNHGEDDLEYKTNLKAIQKFFFK